MSAQTDMAAAVNAVEAAAQQLATAYPNNKTAHKTAAQAVYAAEPDPESANQDVQGLAHVVGPQRVARLANGRLVALGAEAVVTEARSVAGPGDVTWLLDQIQHHVPATAEATAVR